MSDPVSALNGAGFDGLARIEECGLQGMITLRGDLSDKSVIKAATAATGAKMPGQREAHVKGEAGLCWMSPDEVLVLCAYADVAAKAAAMVQALTGTHALAVNVSDARAVFRVSGPASREVMAKLCPVDLAPGSFGPGQIRRTRLAQVPAALWMDSDDSFRIVCFRSVAQYVFDVLRTAANSQSAVGAF
jgi:sarcosine oxidase subunit gamma